MPSIESVMMDFAEGRISESDASNKLFSGVPAHEDLSSDVLIRGATQEDFESLTLFFRKGGTGHFNLTCFEKPTKGWDWTKILAALSVDLSDKHCNDEWNLCSLLVNPKSIRKDCLTEMNQLFLELVDYCSRTDLADLGWIHLDQESAELWAFGEGTLVEPMDEDYATDNERFYLANALGIGQKYLRRVFWGNYWGKKFIEKLGGLDRVKDQIGDLYSQRYFEDGSAFFSLTPDVMDLSKDDPEIERVVSLRKERLETFLADCGVLLPPLEELERLEEEELAKRRQKKR